MSRPQIRKKLTHLLRRQEHLVERLLKSPPMVRGTFSRVQTRCGKPNCWCAHSPKGHAHTRITWSKEGKIRTRKVPPDQIDQIRTLTENYRQFRSLRRTIASLQTEMRLLFNDLETERVEEARKSVNLPDIE
jgi:hypothetical protein